MKNVTKEMQKKCLFIRGDKFADIIKRMFGEEAETEFVLEGSGVNIYHPELDYGDDDVVVGLSEYFDLPVTSFHTDCYDDVGVWIIYK